MEPIVILRYGELGLKGKNRPDFEIRLHDAIGRAMRRAAVRGVIRKTHGRFFVEPEQSEGNPDLLVAALQRVFGLVSVSPAWRVSATLPEIRRAGHELLRRHLLAHPSQPRPITFRVESRRADKAFPLTSQTLSADIGAFLLAQEPDLKVNLTHPAVTIHIEVREGAAYLYSEVLAAPGGLPHGSGGRALLLISGGLDSPVAGWLSLKRGLTLSAVHFESPPFTSPRSLEKVLDLCRVLAGWGSALQVYVVSVTNIQKEIRQHCPEALAITILRRFMLRISELIARNNSALALVTGDSVGQVASQTIESLHTVNAVTCLPVLRPLVTMDKSEIIDLARRIGTFDLSILPYEDCCTLFAPRHPRTRPRPSEAEAAEADLDIDGLAGAAVAQAGVMTVSDD